MENSNDLGKMLGALLVGAAVGGVLGILFAPAKGSETRKKITDGTDDLTKSLKDTFDGLLKDAKNEIDSAKKKVIEFSGDGKVK